MPSDDPSVSGPRIVRTAAILGFIVRNRFAIGSQVQRRFADRLRSGRTTAGTSKKWNHWLPGCGADEINVASFPKSSRHRSGREANPAGHYCPGQVIGNPAGSIVAASTDCKDSSDKTLHEVLVTEFLLALWQTVQHRPDRNSSPCSGGR